MEIKESIKERIILALDVASEREAIEIVRGLREYVGIFKIGLELLNSQGTEIIRKVTGMGGKVFLDGKFHDIPNTVMGASRAVTRMGVRMFNVHAMGGLEMMRSALEASGEEASKLGVDRPLLLAVTVLTSMDRVALNKELRISGDVGGYVAHLALLADKAGVDGVIASPREIEVVLKTVSRKMLVVTPGVRPSWAASQDQKRIMTPSEAIIKGASYLVIGRPIIRPPKEIGTPAEAAKKVVEEITNALKMKGA